MSEHDNFEKKLREYGHMIGHQQTGYGWYTQDRVEDAFKIVSDLYYTALAERDKLREQSYEIKKAVLGVYYPEPPQAMPIEAIMDSDGELPF